jgi:hypothetical protein
MKFKEYFLLNEKLGVIGNAHEEAQKIYEILMTWIDTFPYDMILIGMGKLQQAGKEPAVKFIKQEPNYETTLSDVKYKGLNFEISFEYYDLESPMKNGLILGMATPVIGKDWKHKTNRYYTWETGTVDLQIKIGLDPTSLPENFVNLVFDDPEKFNKLFGAIVRGNISKEKTNCISGISHELSHILTSKKSEHRGHKLKSHINYVSTLDTMTMLPIRKIAEFFYNMYFMHIIELHNIPTQVYSKMKEENISKSNFLSFIREQEEYKKLKAISDYSYEKFINDLKMDIANIDGVLNQVGIPEYIIKTTPLDKKIYEMLDLSYISFIRIVKEKTLSTITPKLKMMSYMYDESEKDEILKRMQRDMVPFGNNHLLFFKKKIDSMAKEANIQLRRLMKIYDYAQ